jgi:glycerol-3-phosphate dehydrogenase subunit B
LHLHSVWKPEECKNRAERFLHLHRKEKGKTMADTSNHLKCELAVIGTGMAGMAAALFAANRGISVIQTGLTGEIIYASGFFDLLSIHPAEKKKVWKDPWIGIKTLTKDIPNHPYARLKKEDMAASFEEILSFLRHAGLPYRRKRKNWNTEVMTPAGTLKTTYCVPETMWAGAAALETKNPCLLTDFHGLKGFSARQIVSVLQDRWPLLRAVRLEFPDNGIPGERYAEQMAISLEASENREKLARAIQPHLKNAEAVGMPAIFGLYRTDEVFRDLERRVGVPVFEIPTLPPAVPGLRLKETFGRYLPEKGVRQFLQKRVLNAQYEKDRGFELNIGDSVMEYTVQSKGVILATGRFMGGGLYADRKGIRETIFDLPVYQPKDRTGWHDTDFLATGGHPIHRAGLETDDLLRPLDRSGHPAFQPLFAAGSLLAHQDWMRMKCGAGLAITTAYAAVKGFMDVC